MRHIRWGDVPAAPRRMESVRATHNGEQDTAAIDICACLQGALYQESLE